MQYKLVFELLTFLILIMILKFNVTIPLLIFFEKSKVPNFIKMSLHAVYQYKPLKSLLEIYIYGKYAEYYL